MKTKLTSFFVAVLLMDLVTACLKAQTPSAFGNLPLWFEAGAHGEFVARGCNSEFTVKAGETKFTLKKTNGDMASCTMRFVGSNPSPLVAGKQPLSGKINRLLGSQPSQWQTGVPTFGQVQLENVYPGVDVVFYGNQKLLEYDFNIAAGANASAIALRFEGVKKIQVNAQGALIIKLDGGEVVQHPPVAYQIINGSRQAVSVRYKILDRQTVVFDLGKFDRTQPLVIDPVLSYSTYYGGNYGDTAWAIAVNPNDGSIYVTGQTFSTKVTNGVPLSSSGAFQSAFSGGKKSGDAFVARFDNSGSNLIYATYLGGSSDDAAYAIAVDGAGNAFVSGFTMSSNFPVINPVPDGDKIGGNVNRFMNTYPADAFVAELDPSGSNLLYSTYIGGNSAEAAYGIAIDPDDNAYITGFTYSTNFPVTPGAFQTRLACTNSIYFNANAFVSMINAGGGSLGYSTYLGGTNFDVGRGIAFNNGRLFVAGYTYSTNFPTTNILSGFDALNGNHQTNKLKLKFISDGFVTGFDASSTNLSLLYSTYLGGTNNDAATAITADAAGNAYVVGYTMSTNFPYTVSNVPGLTPAFVHTNDFKKHFTLATNGFLTQIVWDGSHPTNGYSVMFGGKGVNVANGVALDSAGNVYVVGSATCTNFPVTTNNISWPLSATNSSKRKKGQFLSDAVVMVFNTNCTELLYSAYLGGRDNDFGYGIAVDPTDTNNVHTAYIVGKTLSTNFPTVNALQSYRNGTNDMFIAKISPDEVITLTVTPSTTSSAAQPKFSEQVPSNKGISLRWKMSPVGYDVESCADINQPNWQVVPQLPVATNGWYQLDVVPTNPVQFFRLRKH